MTDELLALILAAGKGTRMKSGLVKVLHPLLGRPMLAYVLDAVQALDPDRVVVVVGSQAEQVETALAGRAGLVFARQTEQLGTGHAVAAARQMLSGLAGTVLILTGDVPLLTTRTLAAFLTAHHGNQAAISVLTTRLENPGHYGRVVGDGRGRLIRVVEARDADADELEIKEINSGIYAVESSVLVNLVDRLKCDNDQGEYYLTDIIGLARNDGLPVAAVESGESGELLGINDRVELAGAVAALKRRVNRAWMEAGVTLVDPESTYIEPDVELAADVTVWPGTLLMGRTRVGPGTEIGPDCQIIDSDIGPGAKIRKGCVVERATVPGGAVIGPLTVTKA